MICKQLNKSFKCCRFAIIINSPFSHYYIRSKNITCSSKYEQGYRTVYSIYKNFNIIVFKNNSPDFAII